MLLSEALNGKRDVFEDCRQKIQKKSSRVHSYRLTAEIILKDGTRRYYRCKNVDHKSAMREVLTFVKSIETELDQQVAWRFKGQNNYYIGSDMPIEFTKRHKIKNIFLQLFDLVVE